MHGRDPFEYVVLRVVPRVERGECLNAGVMLICRPKRFLSARTQLDRTRLQHFAPYLSAVDIDEIDARLQGFVQIAAGDADAGPISALGLGERWHWLSSPSSTIIQPSEVHTGLCFDPEAELEQLFAELVDLPDPKRPIASNG